MDDLVMTGDEPSEIVRRLPAPWPATHGYGVSASAKAGSQVSANKSLPA